MKKIKTTQKTILNAFLKIKGIDTEARHDGSMFRGEGMLFGTCPGFRIRMRKHRRPLSTDPEDSWVMELAVKKSFDRWANSVNFVQEIPSATLHPIAIDLNDAIRQARKVVRAKAFNWDSYFDPIMLDAGYKYGAD
jgi:hypothetical protein